MNAKICVYFCLVILAAAGIAAMPLPPEKPDWKNLKIIPKNTDDAQMERLMYRMTHQLGVTCIYCHPYTKPDVFPKRVDFVTDEKPEKQIARKMMFMTDRLNKKYFSFTNKYDDESIRSAVITCTTCHQGLPKPPKPHQK